MYGNSGRIQEDRILLTLIKKHTLLNKLKTTLAPEKKELLNAYLNLVEKCSPMELSGVNDMSVSKGSLPENEYYLH